jgi:ribonuclease III
VDELSEELRRQVFTHAAWADDRAQTYERLEFLGDSVLGLAIASHLYERFPDHAEGDLARIRAHVVSRESCADVGRALGFDEALGAAGRRIGAADAEQPASSEAVLAEVVEAAIGAEFLAHGLDRVAPAVVDAFADRIGYAVDEHVDFKTVLQEEVARLGRSVTYDLVETSGPPHRRRFTSRVTVGDRELGVGSGPSKKASEQAAAREALARVGDLE